MRAWALAAALAWPATAFGQGASTPVCSVVSQNLAVRDVLHDVYLWYRDLPNLDPARFSSPESFLDAVRRRPLDSGFSYISQKAADDAFFGRSQFVGFGFSTKAVDGRVYVAEVFPSGPAADAGWQRGFELLSIGGLAVDTLVRAGTFASAFGANEPGVSLAFKWRGLDGGRGTSMLVKRVVTIPTVAGLTTFELEGRRVGYFVLRNFVDTTVSALDGAFATLERQGIDELIVDVRYNGGGFVSVAQYLAGLIGGTRTDHQVFAELTHSDRLRARDRVLRFPTPPHALELPRLVVITSRASASASELLINSLRPFVPVVTVGERTLGKPVGQYSIEFCDKVLHPVTFFVRNAQKDGMFFDGIAANCAADDDVRHALGDPREASLAEALHYMRTGACRAAATSAPAAEGVPGASADAPAMPHPSGADGRAAAAPSDAFARDGWRVLVNAW
jgi:hypothetical protein